MGLVMKNWNIPISKNTFTFSIHSIQGEIDLTNSLLSDIDFSKKESIKMLIDKVNSLPINEQLHVIFNIHDFYYDLVDESIKNKNIEEFLSHFLKFGDVFLLSTEENFEIKSQKIIELEKKYKIKIIDLDHLEEMERKRKILQMNRRKKIENINKTIS